LRKKVAKSKPFEKQNQQPQRVICDEVLAEDDGQRTSRPLTQKVGGQGGREAVLDLDNLGEQVGHTTSWTKDQNQNNSLCWVLVIRRMVGSGAREVRGAAPGAAIDSPVCPCSPAKPQFG